jgi:predicted nucleic acid-binding Zn ribbon protein
MTDDIPPVRYCLNCGKPLETTNIQRLFCDTYCKKTAYRQRRKARENAQSEPPSDPAESTPISPEPLYTHKDKLVRRRMVIIYMWVGLIIFLLVLAWTAGWFGR